jgi:hypothetical protein
MNKTSTSFPTSKSSDLQAEASLKPRSELRLMHSQVAFGLVAAEGQDRIAFCPSLLHAQKMTMTRSGTEMAAARLDALYPPCYARLQISAGAIVEARE